MTLTPPSSVFVGVSGASGAPYALRVVRALSDAGCELQLCVSDSGVLVLRHELRLAGEGREPVTREFLELAGAAGRVEVYTPDDLAAPPASGSSCPGAVVLPAMPGFYSRPETLQDAVDHVAGKVLSALGFEQALFPPWDGGRR